MIRPLPFLLLAVTSLHVNGQQNALDFDGADDRVTVANASNLIAGATGTTLGCWFYPRNAAPGFPDFDGIAGFRNENDLDFYLLQLTASTLEARIRFGFADVYTIEGGPIQLNAWNHAALVHDGSTLTLYVNGDPVGSTSAPGTLMNTTTIFQIGNVTYDINEFTLNGRADEVGLWKRALSQAEIQCLIGGSADTTDPDLVLYYSCDQGTAGGNNTSITSLTDAMGNINGEFVGFALTGPGSNFVAGAGVGFSVNAQVCPGETYLYDGQALSAGIYNFSFTSTSGCDSIVNVTVSEIPVNTSVNATSFSLTCLNGSASWQWLDCNDGFAEVPGATFQTFSPQANGSYAVEVTDNGCVDTSACYSVTSIGINEVLAAFPARISPTITNGPLDVRLDSPHGPLTVRVMDASGRTVLGQVTAAKARHVLDVSSLASGSYVMHLDMDGRSRTFRFVRE